jgi:cytochrome P450
VFPKPDRFDIPRADKPRIAFSTGAHTCLGIGLARLELEVALRTLFRRFPHLRLDSRNPPQRRRETLFFSGFNSLHIVTS